MAAGVFVPTVTTIEHVEAVKSLDVISARPKLTTIVMGLGITVAAGIVVGTAIGMFDHQYVASVSQEETNNQGNE